MYSRTPFLATIRNCPNEDGPRLVYADWLEEQGDPEAEAIRVQCERVRLGVASLDELEYAVAREDDVTESVSVDRVMTLRSCTAAAAGILLREADILRRMHRDIRTAPRNAVLDAEFERGLLRSLSIGASYIESDWFADLVQRTYPEELHLHWDWCNGDMQSHADIEYVEQLLQALGERLPPSVHAVGFHHLRMAETLSGHNPEPRDAVHALSAFLVDQPQIERLAMASAHMNDVHIAQVLTATRDALPRLRELSIAYNHVGTMHIDGHSPAIQALLEHPSFPRLDAVDVRGCLLTENDVIDLFTAPHRSPSMRIVATDPPEEQV